MLDQEGLDERAALLGEVRHGMRALEESLDGAARFTAEAGRHGSFEQT